MTHIKKTRTIRRTKSGDTVETIKEEKINDVFKEKRTKYENTITLSQDEIDELKSNKYTAIRVTNTNTGEVHITRAIHIVVADAKRVPRICQETERFIGFTSYFVARFR